MGKAIIKRVLDTVRQNRTAPIFASKDDYGAREMEIIFAVEGRPIAVDSAATVTINAKRSDGKSDRFVGSVNENGSVTVPIVQWMLMLQGNVECTVSAIGTNYKLSTTPFVITVLYSASDGDISEDDPNFELLAVVLAGENERKEAEAERIAAENARVQAERGRAERFEAAQEQRTVAFEEAQDERTAAFTEAENARKDAEAARVIAEQGRETAEEQRKAAELERNSNEAARVNAEKNRADTFSGWVGDMGQIGNYGSRISNLEAAVYGDIAQVVEDDSVAYVKDVPAAAKTNARVDMIGGMTYRVNIGTEEAPEYVLRSTKVTEIESVGKNRFDGIWEKGFINGSGNVDSDGGYYWRTKNYISTPSEFVISSVPSFLYVTVFVMSYDSAMAYIRQDKFYNGFSNVLYSALPANTKYIRLFVELTAAVSDITTVITGVQVELGSLATDFKPYVKHSLPIPVEVQEKPWYGIGLPSAPNSIRYNEDGSRIGDIKSAIAMLDGSDDETWGQNNGWGKSVCNYFAIRLEANSLGYGVQIFEPSGRWNFNTTATPRNGVCCANRGWFVFYDSDIATLDDWRAHLAENPADVVYMMATPITEDISDILPADNYIGVEGGGTLTFVNEYGYDVPSEVTFVTKEVTE